MIFDKKYETMKREDMQKLQLKRLKKIVKYAYDTIPFYKKKYNEAGFNPESIKSLDDIRRIPFVVKDDLRDAYPYGLLAVHTDNLIRIHASSGTSGKPTVVAYTKKDLDMWSDCCARIIVAGGGSSKDIVQISFGYGLFTGALGMHQGYEKLGATVIPASSGNTQRQIMLLKDLKATALVSTPSYALYIGEMIEKLGYKKEDFNLKLGFFGSEASSVEMHKEIQKKLGVFPTDNYGLSEIIGPGVSGECMEKDGMHVNEDHFYPEVLNPDTLEPVKEGEYGELVLTTLTKEGMPIIRYRTKDITSLNYQPCKCGRTTVRMARLRGRTDDMLIVKGVNVFPSQIESVLMDMPEIGGQYEIVVTRDEHYRDTLEVKVEVADALLITDFKNLELLRDKVRNNLRSTLQIDANVKLVEPLSLKRFEGKSKRVTDLRKI
ncbi:MAG: phenylacetate--CoA ligase [Bacillota bacterium]|jgi:phenylacetate-CoA ligase|nr:phenylacetate--CoA ligase [Bacillota bacterium]